METNCTAYIDNEPVRGLVRYTSDCGHVDLTIPHDDGEQTITRLYPPYLISLDDDVLSITHVRGGYNGEPITSVEIPVSNWEWRNLDLKCECGSVDYVPEGHGVYHCNTCDDYLYEKQRT